MLKVILFCMLLVITIVSCGTLPTVSKIYEEDSKYSIIVICNKGACKTYYINNDGAIKQLY